MLTATRTQSGVTLIELMIGIGLLALLLGLAVPSFMLWMQNSQIRTAADAVINGIQLARAEAIRRNKPVEFVLRSGTNWSVVLVNPRTTLLERQGDEGSKKAQLTVNPAGADTVTFNPVGAPAASNQNGSFPIREIDITSSASVTGLRPLRIVISVSGSVRLCDPDPNLPAGDPRRCTI
jgi:type IV fimbrial biogenesis protein FimT